MIRTLIFGGWFDASTVNGRFESSPINQTTRAVAGSFGANVVVVVGPTGAIVVDVVVDPPVELVVDPDCLPALVPGFVVPGFVVLVVVLDVVVAVDLPGTDGGALSSHSTIVVCTIPGWPGLSVANPSRRFPLYVVTPRAEARVSLVETGRSST
jgi:hypothetical protein